MQKNDDKDKMNRITIQADPDMMQVMRMIQSRYHTRSVGEALVKFIRDKDPDLVERAAQVRVLIQE